MSGTSSPAKSVGKLRTVPPEWAALSPGEREGYRALARDAERQAKALASGDASQFEFRVCPKCGHNRQVVEFKRRSRRQGRGPSWCRWCVNKADRERRRRKRERIITGLGKHIRNGTPPAKVELVVATLLRRLGGAEVVGRELADLCRRSMENKSSRDGWRALMLALHMMEAAGEMSRRRRGRDVK